MLELYELYQFASYDSMAILCAIYDSIVVEVIIEKLYLCSIYEILVVVSSTSK
jgi:hypothetical protein